MHFKEKLNMVQNGRENVNHLKQLFETHTYLKQKIMSKLKKHFNKN